MGLMKLKGIRRVNTFTDPELLGEDEVTRLENLILDGGIAKKRGGIQSYDTASPGGNIDNLYELDGYIYGRIGTSLKKLDGTWSSAVKSGLTDSRLEFARYNDTGIFTNGTDDLFTVADSTAHNFIITAPETEETVLTVTTGGSLDASSWYGYRLTYVTSSGEESSFSKIMWAETTTDKSVAFSSLPVSSDTRVTGRKLYRTEAGGDTFYLVTTLDNTDTTYTDISADTSLDTSEVIKYLVEVETAKTLCVHKDRMIFGGITSQNNVETIPLRVETDTSSSGTVSGNLIYGISYTMSNGRETEIVGVSQRTGTISNKTVVVTFAPNRNQDTGDIAEVNIYRKDIDTPFDSYYLVESVAYKSGSITDNTATLTQAYPVGSDSYEEEINKSRVYFSDIDKPQQVPTLNYIDVYPDDDEEIMGLVDQPDGILVLKEKSICMIYTSGSPYNWRVVKLIENVGCTDTNSIQRAVNSVYFRYQNDIYRYPDMKAISREFRDTLDGITIEDTTYVSKHGWYVIVGSSWLYIYDEKNDTWLYFLPSDIPFASAIETVDGIFLLGKEILTYYDESETLDYDDTEASNTAEISVTLRSKTFTVGSPTQGFRLRKLYSNFTQGSSNVIQSLTDPQTGDTRSVTTSDSGEINYRGITDSFTGDLETAHKFYYQISGDLAEFNGMEVEGIMRHRRRTWS